MTISNSLNDRSANIWSPPQGIRYHGQSVSLHLIDAGLGHVTCFGQIIGSRCAISRSVISAGPCALNLALMLQRAPLSSTCSRWLCFWGGWETCGTGLYPTTAKWGWSVPTEESLSWASSRPLRLSGHGHWVCSIALWGEELTKFIVSDGPVPGLLWENFVYATESA